MHPKLVAPLTPLQISLYSAFTITLVAGGVFLTVNSPRQIASVAGSCSLQNEVETQRIKLYDLNNQRVDIESEIPQIQENIVKNAEEQANATMRTASLQTQILSDYTISLEKDKVDTLYNKLQNIKRLDTLNQEITIISQTIIKLQSQITAKKNLETAETRLKTIGSKSSQYKAYLSQYNSLNNTYRAKYGTTSFSSSQLQTQYNVLKLKLTTLNTEYTQLKLQDTDTLISLTEEYEAALASYNSLLEANNEKKGELQRMEEEEQNLKANDNNLTRLLEEKNSTLLDIANIIETLTHAVETGSSNLCSDVAEDCSNIDQDGNEIDDDRDGNANCGDGACSSSPECQEVNSNTDDGEGWTEELVDWWSGDEEENDAIDCSSNCGNPECAGATECQDVNVGCSDEEIRKIDIEAEISRRNELLDQKRIEAENLQESLRVLEQIKEGTFEKTESQEETIDTTIYESEARLEEIERERGSLDREIKSLDMLGPMTIITPGCLQSTGSSIKEEYLDASLDWSWIDV